MKFLGKNEDINVKTQNPEFLNWKWIEAIDLPKVVVDFKKKIYEKIFLEINYLKNI